MLLSYFWAVEPGFKYKSHFLRNIILQGFKTTIFHQRLVFMKLANLLYHINVCLEKNVKIYVIYTWQNEVAIP